jgi:methanogenic corrinoid protein MtbC1
MSHPDPAAAELLTQRAEDIATATATELLQRYPELGDRFGDQAMQLWTNHIRQRVFELSAAMAAGESAMFVSRINWLRATMAARNAQVADLQTCLNTLRASLEPFLDGGARQAALECIDRARAVLDSGAGELQPSTLDPGLYPDRIAMRYIQAVVAGNALPGMEIVMDAVDEGLSVRDAFLKVLLPAQREAGHLWHLNKISVAEEHMVTSTTQRLMAVLASRAELAPDRGRTAVTAAVAGNTHEIGIRAISYLLEFDGWRTIFLGPDVPRSDIPAAIETFDADVTMLSLALAIQLPTLKRTIAAIRERSGDSVKILVGGTGLAGAPNLWRDVGADGYAADADGALTLAAELAP